MGFIRTFKDMASEVDDTFILVEDALPNSEDEMQVIGRRYEWAHNQLGTSKFDPKNGWKGDCECVFAWKPMTKQMKKIFKDNPQKK